MEWVAFQLLDENGNGYDVNGDGVVDDDDIEYSDINGQFWFTNLPIGTYTVLERPDLTDRNDLDGDGLPDGNQIPDDQEGLLASTPISWTVSIGYGEEYAWQAGAAMLAEVHVIDGADPDSDPTVTLVNVFGDASVQDPQVTPIGTNGSVFRHQNPSLPGSHRFVHGQDRVCLPLTCWEVGSPMSSRRLSTWMCSQSASTSSETMTAITACWWRSTRAVT